MCVSPEDVATTASMTYDPEPIETDGHMVKGTPSGAWTNLAANSIELAVWLAGFGHARGDGPVRADHRFSVAFIGPWRTVRRRAHPPNHLGWPRDGVRVHGADEAVPITPARGPVTSPSPDRSTPREAAGAAEAAGEGDQVVLHHRQLVLGDQLTFGCRSSDQRAVVTHAGIGERDGWHRTAARTESATSRTESDPACPSRPLEGAERVMRPGRCPKSATMRIRLGESELPPRCGGPRSDMTASPRTRGATR